MPYYIYNSNNDPADHTTAIQGQYGTIPILGYGRLTITEATSAMRRASLTITSEVQTITVTGAPTGGSFTLTFGGQTTAAIAYNAAAVDVQAALQALSSVGSTNLIVQGAVGGPWTCYFSGTLGPGPQALMTATSSLTGGTSPAVSVTEVHAGIVPSGAGASGAGGSRFAVLSNDPSQVGKALDAVSGQPITIPATPASAPVSGGMYGGLPICCSRSGFQGNFTPGNTYFGNSTGTDVNGQTGAVLTCTVPTQGFRVAYANSISESVAGTPTFSFQVGVSINGATPLPIYFNGRRSVTPDGSGAPLSDVCAASLAVGDTVEVVTFYTAIGTGRWPLTLGLQGPLDGFEVTGTTDKTIVGGVTRIASGTQKRGFGPVAVVAARPQVSRPVVELGGDSIAAATDDIILDRGFMGIALGVRTTTPLASTVWSAKSGELTSQFVVVANSWRRRQLLDTATRLLSNYGTNDIYNGHSLATVEADLMTYWAQKRASGIKMIRHTTISPRTTSTDGWTTTVNQAVISAPTEAVRVALNTWLRGLAAGLIDGNDDIADVIETARNSGIWKVPGVSGTGDISNGTLTIANVSNIASWRVGYYVVGTGIPVGAQITAINGSTITYQASTGSTATTTGLAIAAAYTSDGLHPGTFMHSLMAPAVNTTALLA